MNLLFISIFGFGFILLTDSNIALLLKLQTLLMKCTRHILGFSSYKMLTIQIMNKLEFNTINHMIIKESIHKVIFNNEPISLFKMIDFESKNNNNYRKVRKPIMKVVPKYEKASQSLIYRALYLYNRLVEDVRNKNPTQLANYLKKYI